MRNTRISEKHSILNGRAEIYRTRDSGDVWQFRQYDPATRKHHRKSLRTRDLNVAISAAEQLAQEIGGAEKATSRKTRISAQHKVLDGLAEIYRTSVSGDVWQFRMYFQDEQRHFRKSLKTRDLESALERARRLGADLMGKHRQGIKIFGVSLQERKPALAELDHARIKFQTMLRGTILNSRSAAPVSWYIVLGIGPGRPKGRLTEFAADA